MFLKKTLVAAVVGSAVALSASPALAFHIPAFSFTAEPFTFNATAYGGGNFSAKYIDYSYNAEVDQTCAVGGCTFAESGVGFFGTFRTELGDPAVSGTGLGTDYRMYAIFTGAGPVALGGGGIIGAFTSFTVNVFIDPDQDTTATTFTVGAGGGNETKGVVDPGGDDVNILTGTLIVGGFHVFPGLTAGDFDVMFQVTSFDSSVWGGTAFSGDVVGDINGVNTLISGVAAPPTSFVDASITGSGNTSFAPEPASLSLFALGLLGIGGFLRRRQQRAQRPSA